MPKMELLIKKVFSNFNGENNSANHNISDKIGDELDVFAGGLIKLTAENKENRRLFHLIIMMTKLTQMLLLIYFYLEMILMEKL